MCAHSLFRHHFLINQKFVWRQFFFAMSACFSIILKISYFVDVRRTNCFLHTAVATLCMQLLFECAIIHILQRCVTHGNELFFSSLFFAPKKKKQTGSFFFRNSFFPFSKLALCLFYFFSGVFIVTNGNCS